MDKIINILETIGCVCIAASFFFFSYKYQVANALFWGGLLLVLPRIVQKNIYVRHVCRNFDSGFIILNFINFFRLDSILGKKKASCQQSP